MSFVEFVVEVHGALVHAGLHHAFGGALALAYVAEPRGTVDVDVNVFTPIDDIGIVLRALATIDLRPEAAPEHWLPIAGVRLWRDGVPYPVDVFASLDPGYDEVRRRVVLQPFGAGGHRLPFLSAEDLTVFKLSFGREKDWVDLRAIAASRPDLDADYVERQLVGLRGPAMHPRLARLRRYLRDGHG